MDKRQTITIVVDLLIALLCGALIFLSAKRWFLGFLLASSAAVDVYDSPIYLGVGRGILNGLVPYTDLYENKPPGIFALSALVFASGDTYRTIAYINSFVLFALIGSVLFAVIAHANRSIRPAFRYAGTFAFAVLISLYSWSNAGNFQVEMIGAVFASWYATLLFIAFGRPFQHLEFATSVVCIACAALFKEPFVLVMFAAGLLLVPWDRRLVRNVFLPMVCAGILAIAALFAFGLLAPYVQVYLAEMFQHHIYNKGSPWERGFDVLPLYRSLKAFSPFFVASLACMLGVNFISDCTSFRLAQITRAILKYSLIVYIIVFAVGVGGSYFRHHYVFAVPFLCALFFRFLKVMDQKKTPFLNFFLTGALSLLLSVSVFAHPQKIKAATASMVYDEVRSRSFAESFDLMLDACGIDRYQYLGDNGFRSDRLMAPYGLTRHSPMGPLFLQYPYFFDGSRPDFERQLMDSLRSAKIVLALKKRDLGKLRYDVENTLGVLFDRQPPACAAGFHALGDYEVFFRRPAGNLEPSNEH